MHSSFNSRIKTGVYGGQKATKFFQLLIWKKNLWDRQALSNCNWPWSGFCWTSNKKRANSAPCVALCWKSEQNKWSRNRLGGKQGKKGCRNRGIETKKKILWERKRTVGSLSSLLSFDLNGKDLTLFEFKIQIYEGTRMSKISVKTWNIHEIKNIFRHSEK